MPGGIIMSCRIKSLAITTILFIAIIGIVPSIGIAEQGNNDSPLDKIKWLQGPDSADLGKIAELRVPADYIFAGADDMKTIMEAGENIYSGSELGYLASPNEKLEIIFEFEETGYVKDDEKESLDTAAMLKQLKASNKKGNKERKKRGWKTLDLVDWEIPPHYDEKTNNLEWATRLRTEENEELVNYNTRLLGRTGVMRVTLVTEPGNLENALPSFQNIISDFTYKSGYRYAEYRQGDKIAKYGLTALVVGGATAVAAKSGLLKGLWKLIVAGAVGVAAFLKKILGRKATA
jgi:uncharacterized membrane-anchored protein